MSGGYFLCYFVFKCILMFLYVSFFSADVSLQFLCGTGFFCVI